MEVSGQCHDPAALSLGKSPVTHCTGGWVGFGAGGTDTQNLAPPGYEPRNVQTVASRYTDYAIPAAILGMRRLNDDRLIMIHIRHSNAVKVRRERVYKWNRKTQEISWKWSWIWKDNSKMNLMYTCMRIEFEWTGLRWYIYLILALAARIIWVLPSGSAFLLV